VIAVGYIIMDSETGEFMSQNPMHDGYFTRDLQRAQVYRHWVYTQGYVKAYEEKTDRHGARRLVPVKVKVVIA